MTWFLIGVILSCITLFTLKSLECYTPVTSNKREWKDYNLKLWVIVLIVGINMISILNIIVNILGLMYLVFFRLTYCGECCGCGTPIRIKKSSILFQTLETTKNFLIKELF